jgi:cell division protease FtsH
MVCIFGMSDAIGLAHCAHPQNGMYLPGGDGTFQRDCSERTAQAIDEEVKNILDQAYAEAKTILEQHRDQLELVTGELLRCETLDARAFNRLLGRSSDTDGRSEGLGELAPSSSASTDGQQAYAE